MSYRYREVKCPWCDHVFMWNKDTHDGFIFEPYKLKDSGERVRTATCPKCDNIVAIQEGVLEAMDLDDDRLERELSYEEKKERGLL